MMQSCCIVPAAFTHFCGVSWEWLCCRNKCVLGVPTLALSFGWILSSVPEPPWAGHKGFLKKTNNIWYLWIQLFQKACYWTESLCRTLAVLQLALAIVSLKTALAFALCGEGLEKWPWTCVLVRMLVSLGIRFQFSQMLLITSYQNCLHLQPKHPVFPS